MKVVFVQEVEGSASVGEVKEVRNGYARNYLLPRELALPATKENLRRAERLAKADTIKQDRLDAGAQSIAERIDGATVTLRARVGQQGRLFGSVTAADIAGQLSELAGAAVEHRQVLLGQSIRTIGTHAVQVRLTRNVSAHVTVEVQAEEGEAAEPTIEEAVAAAEAAETEEGGDAPDAPSPDGDAETDT